MSQPNRWIVVDNTDPSITYRPPEMWTPQTVNISQPTKFLVPPLYGTLHECQSCYNASLTFTFTGLHIIARFSSIDSSTIYSCTLDGQPMTIEVSASILQCANYYTVQQGSHIFMVVVASEVDPGHNPLPLFDYLIYDPGEENGLVADVDVGYSGYNPAIKTQSKSNGSLVFVGDTLDFTFVGYSLSIFGTFFKDSTTPSPASYSIDGNMPVNFTISNPTTDLSPSISAAFVLQTPRYSLSQHHLHIDFWGNESNTALSPDFIIVQNMTTPLVLLGPFPAISSPSPSAIPSPISLGPIIGGVTGGVIALVLMFLTWIIYRRRRLQVSTLFGGVDNSNDSNTVVEPFQQQHSSVQFKSRKDRGDEEQNNSVINITRTDDPDVEPNLFIEPFYHWRSHFRSFGKYHILGRRSDPGPVPTDAEPNSITQIARQRPLRYRVHEDSGERVTQPDEGSIIVDLPPTYTTIGFTAPPGLSPNGQSLEPPRNDDEGSRDVDVHPRSNIASPAQPPNEEPLGITGDEGETSGDVRTSQCEGDIFILERALLLDTETISIR